MLESRSVTMCAIKTVVKIGDLKFKSPQPFLKSHLNKCVAPTDTKSLTFFRCTSFSAVKAT